MLRNSYDRFFPIPSFLSMPSFGLDISDESLKFVEIVNTANGIRMGRHGERKIPPGIIESGKIKDPKQMETLLMEVRKEFGVKSVRVSLPEGQIYLFKLRLEKTGLEHVREAIELSLEEHIPIPAQDAIFDYEIISEDAQYLHIQVTSIPKSVLENYLVVFRNAGVWVKSFELEGQAISRAIVKKGDPGTYMIVDFGEKSTGISILSNGVVMFTSTLDVGGSTLDNMISKNFNVTLPEAEKIKKEYGLQRNMPNKEIFPVLLNSVSILRDEISKNFLYWNTHKEEMWNKVPQIEKILLCGGDSNLIGLAEYFSISMKVRVEMANVWINIMDTTKYAPEVNFKKALSFAAALGLALGELEID